jgi:hypothetical protein
LLVSVEEVGGDIPCAAVDEKDGGTVHRARFTGERGIVPFWDRGAGAGDFVRARMMSP